MLVHWQQQLTTGILWTSKDHVIPNKNDYNFLQGFIWSDHLAFDTLAETLIMDHPCQNYSKDLANFKHYTSFFLVVWGLVSNINTIFADESQINTFIHACLYGEWLFELIQYERQNPTQLGCTPTHIIVVYQNRLFLLIRFFLMTIIMMQILIMIQMENVPIVPSPKKFLMRWLFLSIRTQNFCIVHLISVATFYAQEQAVFCLWSKYFCVILSYFVLFCYFCYLEIFSVEVCLCRICIFWKLS